MNRVAVFVDAGYLFAQGSICLAGRKLPRGEVVLQPEAAASILETFAIRLAQLPLLRIYWYDGTSTGPNAQHSVLAQVPNVKVRLGLVNSAGQQKGVDSLIVTDMITLARNRAIDEAILFSGDEDLRVGVQQAQELGVRIHLLGIAPSRSNQSLFLLQEADTTHEWSAAEIEPFLQCPHAAERSGALRPWNDGASEVPSGRAHLQEVASSLALEVPFNQIEVLLPAVQEGRPIPKDLDGRLLARARARTQANLSSEQKRVIRAAFLRACEVRLAGFRERGKVEAKAAPRLG